jgi:hypothetical protein
MGMDEYVSKPILSKLLFQAIAAAVTVQQPGAPIDARRNVDHELGEQAHMVDTIASAHTVIMFS